MAAGRVVLGADAAGIPQLLEQGKWGGLFPADDVVDLAAQLKAFADNSAGSWQTAAAAQTHARAHFEPGAVARQTVAVYRTVAAAGAEKNEWDTKLGTH